MILALLASAAFGAQDVQLHTADGLTLHARASLVPGSERGVVLVHMLGRSGGDWTYIAERLEHAHMSVVAPDLRGQGDNPDMELGEDDYPAMQRDVEAAVAWLREQGVSEVSCAGAALGANLCLRAAADDPDIVNIVLLSPGLNYRGVTSGDAMARYGLRPVLLVASQDDPYAVRSVGVLEKRALGQVHTEILDKAGRGTKMLNRSPTLEGVVTSWLQGTYQLASGELVLPKPAMPVDPGEVHTTGRKLDAHK